MAEQPIIYKESYNKDRGLLEPKWGSKMSDISDLGLQCPCCGSQDMYGSASPDDPEEIFPFETVRCKNCGHITDWFEAHEQRTHHPTDTPRKVVRNAEAPPAPTVYCSKDGKEVPIWYCLGSITQGRELCPHLARATVHGGESAEVECKWKE